MRIQSSSNQLRALDQFVPGASEAFDRAHKAALAAGARGKVVIRVDEAHDFDAPEWRFLVEAENGLFRVKLTKGFRCVTVHDPGGVAHQLEWQPPLDI